MGCVRVFNFISVQKHLEWTRFGILIIADGFPGDILRSLWLKHNVNCHICMPQMFQRQGVFCLGGKFHKG